MRSSLILQSAEGEKMKSFDANKAMANFVRNRINKAINLFERMALISCYALCGLGAI